MSDTRPRTGKVVVVRAMSLDGFIAGPGDAMDWIFDFVTNDAPCQKEAAAATGAMLTGRRTVEVGERMEASNDRGTQSRDEGYPFYGPMFVLTHRPPDPPDPHVTYLAGDGIRFSAPGVARVDLEPLSSTQADGITILRFRVRK